MSLCVNPRCRGDDEPRQTDGIAYLCRVCQTRLERRIGELPELYEALADQLVPTGGAGEPVSGSKETGIQLNEAMVDCRSRIAASLASWSRVVVEDRGLTPPVDAEPASTAPFLARHVDWLSHQPFADEVADEFAELSGRAWSLAYPLGRRRFEVAPCREQIDGQSCTGTYEAIIAAVDDLLPSEITCRTCGVTWQAWQWVTLGRRLHGQAA